MPSPSPVPADPPTEPDWSYSCLGCGWSTRDTRYEQHSCPTPADPPGSDELREAVRRVLGRELCWKPDGTEPPGVDAVAALIRSREADLERRVRAEQDAKWTALMADAIRFGKGEISQDDMRARARAAAVVPEGEQP